MKITDILNKEFVITNLDGIDKNSVLKELSAFLEEKGVVKNKDTLLTALTEREKLGSTGIGENVAIPHAKLEEIDHIITLFGRSEKGVEFESLDKKPVHFVCLVIAPSNSTGQHLKALARISRLLKNPVLREAVLSATEMGKIYSILVDEDSKFI
ncbi:MAG: PTS sugar transporter subunit IIA [Nitrospinaceae bacterium]|jgi:PTS system nitrogen regulatory IIA component|nr:PTS sugar transporter subunit IIA [Nitrospinaceae bacterium]MDP7147918.1 PTS sugar transporter subunit IIA [Nitrospinaceae bacterium]|tara:strand:- start:5471 stop:5935 length:465 start_codon:yes stop_codon:yes gene_type:complete